MCGSDQKLIPRMIKKIVGSSRKDFSLPVSHKDKVFSWIFFETLMRNR